MVCSTREVYGSVKVVRRTPRVCWRDEVKGALERKERLYELGARKWIVKEICK